MRSPSRDNRNVPTIEEDLNIEEDLIKEYKKSQEAVPVRTTSAFPSHFSASHLSIFIRFPVVAVDWAISAVLVLVIRPPSQPFILLAFILLVKEESEMAL